MAAIALRILSARQAVSTSGSCDSGEKSIR
jgi:hypothetical protein